MRLLPDLIRLDVKRRQKLISDLHCPDQI